MEGKMKKNTFDENSNFAKQLMRVNRIIIKNEEKYCQAKEEYLKNASSCYDMMEKLLNTRFEIINPAVIKVS